MLFLMNIFDGFAAANYFVVNDSRDVYCLLQTISIQVFEIGGWIYECLFAIETFLLVRSLLDPKKEWSNRKKPYVVRNIMYLSVITIYGLVMTIIIIVTGNWDLSGEK